MDIRNTIKNLFKNSKNKGEEGIDFDTWSCLLKYPDLREGLLKDVLDKKISSIKNEVHKRLIEKYPEENFSNKKETGKLKVVLKTYNEDFYLEEWLKYYEKIIGLENVIILDHESSSEKVKEIYKKYEDKVIILKFPRKRNHDHIHNTELLSVFFDFIRENCKFFCILDTDEFLCRYDGEKIVSNNITEKIIEQSNHSVIGIPWLNGYFKGEDLEKPSEINSFNGNPKHVRNLIVAGKIVVRNDNYEHIVAHNRRTPGVQISSDVFLLHIKKANIKNRIKSQINTCVTFGFITEEESKDRETILKKLEPIFKDAKANCVKEVYHHLKNEDKHRRNMTDYDEDYLIKTNVIESTIYQTPIEYDFINKEAKDLKELIEISFNLVKDRFHKDADLIK